MTRRRQVAVVGKGEPDEGLAPLAEDVGRRLAEAGAIVVCGGLGGVMEAAARGAREAGGEVIGVLPGEDPVAIGGEWGTLAEMAFARRLGRPVVALHGWRVSGEGTMKDAPGIAAAEDAAEAVVLALSKAGERRSD
ncbi:MAG: hypothetical protein AUG48_10785 [Actinobacteria bacterium 13_1_20CM_3_68_9]|nr:MAG: hypothetical protein AUG48_10785 [Actinobacteria bacterium 13_1_20CM_3_68_9]